MSKSEGSQMKLIVLFVFVLTCGLAQQGKVVFLRGDQVLSAWEDGTNVEELTLDPSQKRDPKWSPDGSRIVAGFISDRSADPKTHIELGVMTGSGKAVSRVPVFATQPDGTIRAGMRFVEDFGWFSNHELYASGSANPTTEELRQIEI